jgi:hypothetical protein
MAPTLYPSQVASAYKSGQDVNGAILSNSGGSLYVYPNNPNALSVLVDPAFNIPQMPWVTSPGPTQTGLPFTFNGAASPVTVSLTAPGSNSYYATIYWNPNSVTGGPPNPPTGVGVVYGTASATPVPILPDDASFVTLAIVLIASTTTAITNAMIYDVRLWFPRGPVRSYIPSASTNQAVNCMGATNVVVDITITAAITLTLNNLQVGIPVYIIATNSAGSSQTIAFAGTTPDTIIYNSAIKQVGASTGFTSWSTPLTIGAGHSWIFSGNTEYAAGVQTLKGAYG